MYVFYAFFLILPNDMNNFRLCVVEHVNSKFTVGFANFVIEGHFFWPKLQIFKITIFVKKL
jgi:hypothetical protein